MIDENRPYRRIEIDRVFAKAKGEMHAAALLRGKAKGFDQAHYQDIYTGKDLLGGDPYEYDHIRSSEEIHSKYKSILNDNQIALVVNCPENIGVTLSLINKSKGKRKMEDWLSNKANIVVNEINLNLTLTNLKRADQGIVKRVMQLQK